VEVRRVDPDIIPSDADLEPVETARRRSQDVSSESVEHRAMRLILEPSRRWAVRHWLTEVRTTRVQGDRPIRRRDNERTNVSDVRDAFSLELVRRAHSNRA
jgi:hypothetical protein